MNLPFDDFTTPLALLAIPVLFSLIARNFLVFLSVLAVSAAGAIAAAGIGIVREQWLVTGLVSLSGMLFTLQGWQARGAVRSVERLKDDLLELRLTTSSLRNAIEQERGRSI